MQNRCNCDENRIFSQIPPGADSVEIISIYSPEINAGPTFYRTQTLEWDRLCLAVETFLG